MREILFRGKRLDNGEWVCGFYAGGFSDGSHEICNINSCTCERAEVYGDTVGEYTGLKDKNGKRIFEGDILSLRTGRPHVVRFEDGAFVLENTAIPVRFANKFEVIGNIHDNPGLLDAQKGGAEG